MDNNAHQYHVLTRWLWDDSYGPEPKDIAAWEDIPAPVRDSIVETHRRARRGDPVRLASSGTSEVLGGRFYWARTVCDGEEPADAPLLEFRGASVPSNHVSPDWDEEQRVHNWRNHVPPFVREIWGGFTLKQRKHLALWAESLAREECWE